MHVYMSVYTYIKLVWVSLYFTKFNPVTVVTVNLKYLGYYFIGIKSETGKWFVFPVLSYLNQFKICSRLQQVLWLNVCWCFVFVKFVSVLSLVTTLVTCKATLKREHETWSCQMMFCINELYLKLCLGCFHGHCIKWEIQIWGMSNFIWIFSFPLLHIQTILWISFYSSINSVKFKCKLKYRAVNSIFKTIKF